MVENLGRLYPIEADQVGCILDQVVLSTLAPLRSAEVVAPVGLRLRCCDHSHHLGKSLSMDAPALRQREGLVAVRLGAEKGSDLVEDATALSSE